MKSIPRTLVRTAALVVSFAAAVSLVGCSADADAATDVADTGSAELQQIKVVVAPIHFESVYIAQQEGFFEANGLDVEIVSGGAPAQNVAMAVSGEADITTGSWGTAITSIAQGMPLKVISGNGYTSPDFATSGIVVPGDSPITSVADLVGKKVGIQGLNTGSEVPMFLAAKDAGIDPLSIERVEIASSGMATALEEGTIDAVLASSPFFNQLEASGNRVISTPSKDFLPKAPVTVWTVTESWLAENAEAAAGFNAAMTEADAFYSDPANVEAVLDITAEVSQVDRDSLSGESLIPISTEIDVAAATLQRDGFVEFGIIPEAPEVDDILWSEAPRG